MLILQTGQSVNWWQPWTRQYFCTSWSHELGNFWVAQFMK